MSEKDNKILKHNHGENSMKVSFIIYADLECLLKKTHSCYNNPEESSKSQNIYAYTFWLLIVYKLFIWKKIKKSTTKIINYEKKEMILLTDKGNKSYEKQKICYICKKEFWTDDDDDDNDDDDDEDDKKYQKVRDHCHCTRKFRGTAHNICNLRYNTPK